MSLFPQMDLQEGAQLQSLFEEMGIAKKKNKKKNRKVNLQTNTVEWIDSGRPPPHTLSEMADN